MDSALQLDEQLLKRTAGMLRILTNDWRQKIIKFIHKKGRTNVLDIRVWLHLDESTTSQHLALLRNEGLVYTERSCREIYYSINYEQFKEVDRLIKEILQ